MNAWQHKHFLISFWVAIVAFLFPSEFAYFHILAVLLHKISLEMASVSFALLGRRSRTLLKEWWSHAFTCMGNGSRNVITLRYTKKSLMRTWSWCVNGSWRLWNGHQMIQTRRRLAEEGMQAYFSFFFSARCNVFRSISTNLVPKTLLLLYHRKILHLESLKIMQWANITSETSALTRHHHSYYSAAKMFIFPHIHPAYTLSFPCKVWN